MTDTSFLPEDYLAKKAERRTSLVCLVLFMVVMAAVFGAFLVTNRQWTFVKDEQNRINAEYQTVAKQIEQLTELEQQKGEMLGKAELAAALVERVPRSILLAEIINRMPEGVGLLQFELDSAKVVEKRAAPDANSATGRLKSGKPTRGRTVAEARAEGDRPKAIRYKVKVSLVGVAPTDLEVSRFLASLNAYELMTNVTLEYSEEKEINERLMRQFRVSLDVDPSADIRAVEPLIRDREMTNPMNETQDFAPKAPQKSASVDD